MARERSDLVWRRVEAILDKGDVIGRGASSVVLRGRLGPAHAGKADAPLVAVKVGLARALHPGSYLPFEGPFPSFGRLMRR